MQDFGPYLEIKGGDSPPPPPPRRRSAAKASAAATQARKDSVLNAHSKEFYPADHVKTAKAKGRRRRGKGARWATTDEPSKKVTSAPATINDDGDAEG